MSSTISTRAPRRDREAAPQLERAVLALDEDRLGAEPARRLVARHDAADRRRSDDVDRAERRARLLRQRAAQPLGARRILEDEHLLQKHRRVQAGGKDEMPLEQRAGGAEFVERLVCGQCAGHAPFHSRRTRKPSGVPPALETAPLF